MRKFLFIAAAILIGALAGTLGGLIAAKAVPKCGEDCFTVVGAFVAGGGLVGALAFGMAGIGLTEMNWHRRALALVSLTLTLVLIATLMISRHYSQMHDPQDSSLPFTQAGKQ